MENEQKQGIVKSAETRLPKFVEDAYESIEKMEHFAQILLDSKLVPDHFYEKLPAEGNKKAKPDFTKGKVPAVVAVLIQGYQLQLPPLTALQHIIPVNGLLSIKGDLAKSMIFNSGKLKSGSWLEEETGSIDAGNLVVKITATRSDNGQTLSRSFSIAEAKRAGLWITEQQVNSQDGWKYSSSAWWKYPSRMINYRALGFLARDMFPDVMAGIYTTEEAMDLPKDTAEIIETESGAKITLPDKEHAKKRSDKMTERAADKIPDNKFGVVNTPIPDAVVIEPEKKEAAITSGTPAASNKDESPFIPQRGSSEFFEGKEVVRDEEGTIVNQESTVEDPLDKKDTKDLLKIVMEDMDMMEASEILPGKNTKKKLLDIITAHKNNNLAELVAPHMKKEADTPQTDGEINPNKDFDKAPEPGPGNKYGIEIPEYDKGTQRDFAVVKTLFNKMMGVEPQITTPRFMELAQKLNFLTTYADKETFVKLASVAEINLLLNTN